MLTAPEDVPPELDTLATVDEVRACYAWTARSVASGKLDPKRAQAVLIALGGAARLLGKPGRGDDEGAGTELDPNAAALEAEARAAERRAQRLQAEAEPAGGGEDEPECIGGRCRDFDA